MLLVLGLRRPHRQALVINASEVGWSLGSGKLLSQGAHRHDEGVH